MRPLPTAPAAGAPVSATLIRQLIDAIRQRTILRGPGYHVKESANGICLEIERNQGRHSQIPGLFTIGKTDDGRQIYEYPYYMIGTRLYRASDEDMWFSPGQTGISCLCVDIGGTQPRAVLYLCETFAEVQELAEDPTRSVKPLYEFKDGVAIRDFRNMPTMSPWEFER